MSTNNDIKLLLDIQDKNIEIDENTVEKKIYKEKMAFEYTDAVTGDIIDILDSRVARTIKEHFTSNYHLSDLRKVETVTIDMNAGYVNVIKEIFPQAKIIIDYFHIVQLISRSMNKTRV